MRNLQFILVAAIISFGTAAHAESLTGSVSEQGTGVEQSIQQSGAAAQSLAGVAETGEPSSETDGVFKLGADKWHKSHEPVTNLEAADTNLEAETPSEDHGATHVGVLGFTFTQETLPKISAILPGSDMKRFHVHVGDHIVAYNGHPFVSWENFQQEIVGPVGTTFDISIKKHNGTVVEINPMRTESKNYVQYGDWYKNVSDQEKSW